jgi:hypothetical protein
MTLAINQTIEIYRGEEVELPFTLTPVTDISGWTIQFTVAKGPNSSIKTIDTMAGTITSAVDGEFSVNLTAEVTGGINPGNYYYDVWRTDADSERVIAAGLFRVLPVARLPLSA